MRGDLDTDIQVQLCGDAGSVKERDLRENQPWDTSALDFQPLDLGL